MDKQSKQNNILPIQKQDRIQFLDVLRGIAIFFIFSANIPVFSGFIFFQMKDDILKRFGLQMKF